VLVKLERGDHGFDTMATLKDLRLEEGLDFVKRAWLK